MARTRHVLARTLSALRPLLVLCIAAVSPRLAHAQSFYSTGAGVTPGSADLHWLVSASINGGAASSFQSAYMWANPGWISNTPSGSNGGIGNPVIFDFRQTFDLTGFNAATATLSFVWGCDDTPAGWPVLTPYFTVNGGAAQGAGTCGSYNYGAPVTVTGFQSGVNTLDFFVEGNGQTDGLELNTVAISAVTATPEPASLALLATGLVGIAGVARRRKRLAA